MIPSGNKLLKDMERGVISFLKEASDDPVILSAMSEAFMCLVEGGLISVEFIMGAIDLTTNDHHDISPASYYLLRAVTKYLNRDRTTI